MYGSKIVVAVLNNELKSLVLFLGLTLDACIDRQGDEGQATKEQQL